MLPKMTAYGKDLKKYVGGNEVSMSTTDQRILSSLEEDENENFFMADIAELIHVDAGKQLLEYIHGTPVDTLNQLLLKVPWGTASTERVEGFPFTKWQMFWIYCWAYGNPFSSQVSMNIDVPLLHLMACYSSRESRRQQPIYSKYSLKQDVTKDFTLLNLPPGSGKTALSLAAAMTRICPGQYEELVSAEALSRNTGVCQGNCVGVVSRLIMVATFGVVREQFEVTLESLLPVFKHMWGTHLTFEIWSGLHKRHSVQEAAKQSADKAVIWFLDMNQMNQVLRVTPDVLVAVCIMDEFIVTPPRQKTSYTCASRILKTILLQATTATLVEASRGMTSQLKRRFNGELIPPSNIRKLIEERKFVNAVLAVDQACLLHIYSTNEFRVHIRADLEELMPCGTREYAAFSSFSTLSSYIHKSSVDMVPANFSNVLLHRLRPLSLTEESVDTILALSMRTFSVQELVDVLMGLFSQDPLIQDVSKHPKMCIVTSHLEDFKAQQCPICCSDGLPSIYGCCGAITCAVCKVRIDKCPFCRAPIQSSLKMEDIPKGSASVIQTQEALDYPPSPSFQGYTDLMTALRVLVPNGGKQISDMTNAMHCTMEFKYTRLLILVQGGMSWENHTLQYVNNFCSAAALAAATGYKVHQLTRSDIEQNRARGFNAIKSQFDDIHEGPQAIFCYDLESSIIGADLKHADCIIAVGRIPQALMTQMIGRAYRPLVGRDRSKPLQIIKICSGTAPTRGTIRSRSHSEF